jgi:predicted adenylyl cyclase CyaB
MAHINVEIKARCSDHERIRKILEERKADHQGEDHQIDSYFVVPNGRLKLREGTIENNLIFYERENSAGPKQSNIMLYPVEPGSLLKELLTKALGVLVTVDKKRNIYFAGNVKIHLDVVAELGSFVEIEARDVDGTIGRPKLLQQCQEFRTLFDISDSDLLTDSYSDMLLKKNE